MQVVTYRYFLRKFANYYSEVYRIPDNGKCIVHNIPHLEKYISPDKWSNDSKDIKGLLEDLSTGYFSETSDEIHEMIAIAITRLSEVYNCHDD
jgi:hypothetical protein